MSIKIDNKKQGNIFVVKHIFEKTRIDITISIGIAQIIIGKENASEAIARADAALYFSKKNGRNCLSIHQGKDKILLAKKT